MVSRGEHGPWTFQPEPRRFYTDGVATMMLASQKGKIPNTDDSASLGDSWASSRNLPWVPASSRRVLVTCITESMWAAARSSIIRDSHAACTGLPWKRFLSLLSGAADPPGPNPLRHRASKYPASQQSLHTQPRKTIARNGHLGPACASREAAECTLESS